MSLTWTAPVWMWPLLLVLAAGAVVWTVIIYGWTRPAPPASLGKLLVGLRAGALVLLVIAVAGPVLSRFFKQEEPAQLVFLLEDSASMNMTDGGWRAETPPDGPSRWQAGLNFAARVDSALVARSWPGASRYLRGNGLEPVAEFSPTDPVIPDPQALGTDIGALIAQTGDRLAADPVKGMILFSDGQETSRRPGTESRLSTGFLAEGNGLVVGGVGDPQGAADRLIRDLRYPERAFAGDEVLVELTVTHRFLVDEALTPLIVTLTEGSQVVADTTFTPSGETTRVELPFQATEEGLRLLELSVSALDNERFLANNKMSLAVNVQRGRSRLLALASRPGWDLRFLAQAALAESRVDLAVVYPGAEGPVFADSLVTWKEPQSVEEWNRWDAVILLGWQGWASGHNWNHLAEAVSNGLGLLVLPDVGVPGRRQLAGPPAGLMALMPVAGERPLWVESSFTPLIPAGQGGHPVLRGVGGPGNQGIDGQDTRNGLAALPPLRRILGMTVKSETLTLLQGQSKEPGRPEQILPLLVVDQRGQGRVAWFGGQRLWEQAFWRSGSLIGGQTDEVQAAAQLMQNLLVWLAAGDQDSGLTFTGRRPFYQEGERVVLGAQWLDLRGQPVRDRELTLVLKPRQAGAPADTSLEERTYALSPVPQQPDLFQSVLPPLPPGYYTVQLVGQGDPPVLGPEEALVITAHSIEETQVRQDSRFLGQQAQRRGGSYVSLSDSTAFDQVMGLLDRLDWSGRTSERRQRWDFWSGWPYLTLVVLLLGLEWYLRRRHGLL